MLLGAAEFACNLRSSLPSSSGNDVPGPIVEGVPCGFVLLTFLQKLPPI